MKQVLTKSSLFILGPLLVWMVLYWGFSFNGLYGQDAHEYLRYTKRITGWISIGASPGDYFWPLYYPIYGAVVSFFLQSELLSLQWISLVSVMGSGLLLYHMLRTKEQDADHPVELYTLACFSCSPYVLRSGMLVMSDALAMFFVCLFLWAYSRLVKVIKLETVLLAMFAVVSGVMTRYAVAVLLLLPVLHIAFLVLKNRDWRVVGLGIMLLLVLITPHLLLRGEQSTAFLGHSFLENWHWSHWGQRSFQTNTGMHQYPLPNLLYGFYGLFHPGYFVLGILVVWAVKKRDFFDFESKLFLAALILYSLFLAGINFQNNRFLLISIPLTIVLLYPAFCRLYSGLSGKFARMTFWSLLLMIQLYLFSRSMQLFVHLNQLEQQIALKVNQQTPNTLYTFYVDGALKSYATPHKLVNLWKAPLTNVREGELVVFHPTKFNEQWKGHQLMKNWKILQNEIELVLLEDLPQGWKLYQAKKSQVRFD